MSTLDGKLPKKKSVDANDCAKELSQTGMQIKIMSQVLDRLVASDDKHVTITQHQTSRIELIPETLMTFKVPCKGQYTPCRITITSLGMDKTFKTFVSCTEKSPDKTNCDIQRDGDSILTIFSPSKSRIFENSHIFVSFFSYLPNSLETKLRFANSQIIFKKKSSVSDDRIKVDNFMTKEDPFYETLLMQKGKINHRTNFVDLNVQRVQTENLASIISKRDLKGFSSVIPSALIKQSIQTGEIPSCFHPGNRGDLGKVKHLMANQRRLDREKMLRKQNLFQLIKWDVLRQRKAELTEINLTKRDKNIRAQTWLNHIQAVFVIKRIQEVYREKVRLVIQRAKKSFMVFFLQKKFKRIRKKHGDTPEERLRRKIKHSLGCISAFHIDSTERDAADKMVAFVRQTILAQVFLTKLDRTFS